MKNKKGITLIALIITIIVMLILVAVTVAVAINGGLFNTAKNAAERTQKEIEKEELLSYAIGAYNKETHSIDVESLENSIDSTKYPKDTSKTSSIKYVVTGQSGTIWQIDLRTGEVTEYKEQQNPWLTRGIDPSLVEFDVPYVLTIDPNYSITIYSDGGINLLGTDVPSSDIQDAWESHYITISSNTINTGNEQYVLADDETYGKTILAYGYEISPMTFLAHPTSPLSGRTFVNPISLSPALSELAIQETSITFEDFEFEIMNRTGKYTYAPDFNLISFIIAGDNSFNDSSPLNTIEENGEIINTYFYFDDVIMTEHGTDGMAPFSGTFEEQNDPSQTITFSTHNGYGCIYRNDSNTPEYYCFDDENDKISTLVAAKSKAQYCSCVQEGNTITLTIGDTVYINQQ